MSNVETETTTVEEQDPFEPAADFEDLFADEETVEETAEPEDLSTLSEDDLRARLAKAEKAAKFEREQRVQTAKKIWIEEAKRHFPYSNPEKINADSRRAFLKAAEEQDKDFRVRAKDVLEQTQKTREEVEAEVRAQVEAEARKAWGLPSVSSGGVPIEEAELNKRVEDARRRRDLKGVAKALMDGRAI